MVRGMDNSTTFQNGQNKARSPGRLGKNIVEEQEGKKVVGDDYKQDNALKDHPILLLNYQKILTIA
jgi:hypothetical protein